MANITSPTHMQALRDRRGVLLNLRAIDGPFSPARRTLQCELALEAAAKAGRPLPPTGLDTTLVKGGRVRSDEESPRGVTWSLGRWSPRKMESSRPIREPRPIAAPQRYPRLPSNLSGGISSAADAGEGEGGEVDGGSGGGSGPSPRQRRQSTRDQPQSPEVAWTGIGALISPLASKLMPMPPSGDTNNSRGRQLPTSPMSPSVSRGGPPPGSPVRLLSSPSLQARKLFSTSPFPPHLPPVRAPPPGEGLLYILYDPIRTSHSQRSASPPGAFESSPGPPPRGGRGYLQRFSPGTGVFFPRPSLGLSEKDSVPARSRTKSRLQRTNSVSKKIESHNRWQDSTPGADSQVVAMLSPGGRHRAVDPCGGQENTHRLPPRYKEHSYYVGANGHLMSPTWRTAVINSNLPTSSSTEMGPPGGLWNDHVGLSEGSKGCSAQQHAHGQGKTEGVVVFGGGWKAKAESKQKGSTILGRRGIKTAALEMGLVPIPPLRITSTDIIGTFATVTMAEREQLRVGHTSEELVTFSI